MATPRRKTQTQRRFDPQSFDAQFATLHTTLIEQNLSRNSRMDAQEDLLRKIEVQTTQTNGRVTILENKWKSAMAWVSGASFVGTGIITVAIKYITGH